MKINNDNEKIINNCKIKLIPNPDSIKIIINKINSSNTYESNFKIEYLRKFKLLYSSFTIDELIQFIYALISQNNVKIEEKENNLKLTLISTLVNHPNVELLLNNQSNKTNEIIEKKKKSKNNKNETQITNLKNELINLYDKEKNILNMSLQNKTLIINQINKLNSLDNEIEKLHKRIYENLIQNYNLETINSIIGINDQVYSISIFPSGNFISVSNESIIHIYDCFFNIIQKIENAHEKAILYVDVKDENNFVTCSVDKNIKTWIKENNKFTLNKIILNAHNDIIRKVLYFSNGNLISCSLDCSIKIWKQFKDNYYNIKIFNHNEQINSILLLENKNIFISSGEDGTKIWDLKNYECIFYNKETFCGSWNGICIIDDDKIIVQGKNTKCLKVISINDKKIIHEIYNSINVWGLFFIKEKDLILVGGNSKDILIYYKDNYQLIKRIENAHNKDINGFIQLNNGNILSYSDDRQIKSWVFKFEKKKELK